MLEASLVGWNKGSKVLHAVTMDKLPPAWPNGPAEGACGEGDLYLMEHQKELVPWPPRVVGLAPYVRCRDCYGATGCKSPRCSFQWIKPDG